MAKFAAIVEQGDDGSWSACVVSGLTMLGQGATKSEALEDLREALSGAIEYLRETGQAIPISSAELVSVEVAA